MSQGIEGDLCGYFQGAGLGQLAQARKNYALTE